MSGHLPPPSPLCDEAARLSRAIEACTHATVASRELDSLICRAIFPGVAEMEELEPGIWQGNKGDRVRALRFSGSWKAAATLVPAGWWIEQDCGDVILCGPGGDARGNHAILPIALCLAALRARERRG